VEFFFDRDHLLSFAKNISEKAPKKYQTGLRSELTEMFNCESLKEARARRDQIIEEYRDVAESAMICLDEGFESAMTVMTLPKTMRRNFRTSNQLERLKGELKRRSKVIGIFPNEASLILLMGSVLMEQNAIRQNKNALFSRESYRKMLESDVEEKLQLIAANRPLC
jgi:putative transposase